MNKKKFVCFVAGKSGGHILPALVLAKKARDDEQKEIMFFSSQFPLDKSLLCTNPLISKTIFLRISTTPKKIVMVPWWFFQIGYAFFQSFFMLLRNRPEKIVSMGGYVSIPVCIAGWLLRIPIILYEVNAVPGKAIKFLSRLATEVYVCFDLIRPLLPVRVVCTSYPLRFTHEDCMSLADARAHLQIPADYQVLLVIGGSQGSQFLNELAKDYILHRQRQCVSAKIFVLHQTGYNSVEALSCFYNNHHIAANVFSFVPHIAPYYAAADKVIARAGSGTLFELKFFKKCSMIIPLETNQTNHQVDNAYAVASYYPEIFSVYRQKAIEADPVAFYQHINL